MTELELIIQKIKALSPEDRIHLVRALLEECLTSPETEREAAALRGWLALAESSNEDWSEFYPESIRRLIRERSHDQR